MKSPWEWEEEDLQQLIKTETKEHLGLDYKASASLRNNDTDENEISKDVSAFANSAGGIIIYGILKGRVNSRDNAGLFSRVVCFA